MLYRYLLVLLLCGCQPSLTPVSQKPSVQSAGKVDRPAVTAIIKSCTARPDLNYVGRGTPQELYVFSAELINRSSTPLSHVDIYARTKEPDRTVPDAETVRGIPIPGGIAPQETRTVTFTIPTSAFGMTGRVNEPNNGIAIAVVASRPPTGVEPYRFYSQVPMTRVKFARKQTDADGRVRGIDPELSAILDGQP